MIRDQARSAHAFGGIQSMDYEDDVDDVEVCMREVGCENLATRRDETAIRIIITSTTVSLNVQTVLQNHTYKKPWLSIAGGRGYRHIIFSSKKM